jgi:ribosomal protein S12 methylthiotransferase
MLVDQPLLARTEADAPDVDATVVLKNPAPVGEFIRRKITGTRGYDLLA